MYTDSQHPSSVARGHLKAKSFFFFPKVGEIDSQHLIAVARGPLLDALPSLRDALALHLPSAPQDGGVKHVRVSLSLSYSKTRTCFSLSLILQKTYVTPKDVRVYLSLILLHI
jgi:hypothetical protein